jgi:hypothetical protein
MAQQLRDELDHLYSEADLKLNTSGNIRVTTTQYLLFGDHESLPSLAYFAESWSVELLHFAGLVSIGLHYGNGLVKEMATKLLPRLQALAAPDKNAISLTRYHSENLVTMLGKPTVFSINGIQRVGIFKGAWPIPQPTGVCKYNVRLSGIEEREFLIDLSSFGEGGSKVWLESDGDFTVVSNV